VIEQTMVSLDARPGQDRQIPTRFEPGQSYRWRLATLLSAGSEDANGSAR
jgi:hypothetical protein